jgi:hypothetical protein
VGCARGGAMLRYQEWKPIPQGGIGHYTTPTV